MNWSLHFLGVGAAHAVELGSSAVVLERDGKPLLLIDCGPDTLDRYVAAYGEPPRALYITHTHMDHIGGMERLFFRLWFDEQWRGRTQVFVHAGLVPWLQARVADYPNVLAEGGVNFWEAFRLVPCTRGFWLDGLWFDVFGTRHHMAGTSYGVALARGITGHSSAKSLLEKSRLDAKAILSRRILQPQPPVIREAAANQQLPGVQGIGDHQVRLAGGVVVIVWIP